MDDYYMIFKNSKGEEYRILYSEAKASMPDSDTINIPSLEEQKSLLDDNTFYLDRLEEVVDVVS